MWLTPIIVTCCHHDVDCEPLGLQASGHLISFVPNAAKSIKSQSFPVPPAIVLATSLTLDRLPFIGELEPMVGRIVLTTGKSK